MQIQIVIDKVCTLLQRLNGRSETIMYHNENDKGTSTEPWGTPLVLH